MIETVDHDDYLELLAGAAIDDLDDDEATRLHRHAATCPTCAAEMERIDATLVALAIAVPQRRPPDGLEARILAAIQAEPDVATPSRIATPAPVEAHATPSRAESRWTGWLRRPVVTFAAIGLVLVLGSACLALARQSATLDSALQLQDAAIAVLADPGHIAAPLLPEAAGSGSTAMAVYLPASTQAYVMATGLPATPAGHVYQLWSADAAGVHPLGTFTFDGHGTFVAPFGVDLSTAAAAMITLEPTGGSTGTPGPQVVFGELPAQGS